MNQDTNYKNEYLPLDTFIDLYCKLHESTVWRGLSHKLNDKLYTVKDSDVSYRVINHWSSKDIIQENREKSGWRKFSVLDLIWLKTLQKLRDFGLSIEQLKNLSDTVYKIGDKNHDHRFETAVSLSFRTSPVATYLMVYSTGAGQLATAQTLSLIEGIVGKNHPYIKIDLNSVYVELSGKEKFLEKSSILTDLEKLETKLQSHIEDNNAHEIRIKLKDKTVKEVQIQKELNSHEQISEAMQGIEFGNLEVVIRNGKPAYTTTTKKIKT
jgi:DNA-binding transcriptional MerR regulator